MDLNAVKKGRRKVKVGDAPTKRQLHVLQYIWRRCEQGWPPTLAEIGTSCYPSAKEESSRQSARHCVYWLEKKGLLQRSPRIARGLKLTARGLAACQKETT
uniref:Putative transcriptional repressor n=1 Tax=viral metagenome TaxID=1070528 RepID=A0A6M3LPT4_9ZZZZ